MDLWPITTFQTHLNEVIIVDVTSNVESNLANYCCSLGAVHKWRKGLGGRGYQGFCDNNSWVLLLKSVTIGEGGFKKFQILRDVICGRPQRQKLYRNWNNLTPSELFFSSLSIAFWKSMYSVISNLTRNQSYQTIFFVKWRFFTLIIFKLECL